MSVAEPQPAVPKLKLRWCHLTPGRVVVGLLAVEALLWLSQRFGWAAWHKGYAVFTAVAILGVVILALLLWWLAALIFRWRFQFSLRSLLVLVVVVALPSGWLAREMKRARNQQIATGKSYLSAEYDWQYDANGDRPSSAQPPEPNWLRNLLGSSFFDTVVSVAIGCIPVTDAELEDLRGLEQLETLVFWDSRITPGSLRQLKGFPKLSQLIFRAYIPHAGLEQFKDMARLRTLALDDFNINDADLEVIGGLTQVTRLSLLRSQVTDAGLEHLKGMTQLQHLYIGHGRISDEGVAKLQKALPNCEIER